MILANDIQTNLEILLSTRHISAVLIDTGISFDLLRLKIRVIFSGKSSIVFFRNLHIYTDGKNKIILISNNSWKKA